VSVLVDAALREVVELHDVFTGWLGRGEGTLDRVAAALAADFHMVDPIGRLLDRAAVMAIVGDAMGRMGPDFRIEIKGAEAAAIGTEHVLLTYIERQHQGAKVTARRSSALLRTDEHAPLALAWIHLQETWISADA
jgi:hypothetical protein